MSAPAPQQAAPRTSLQWYAIEQVLPGLTKITEPHVHPMLRSNIWWLQGQDRDVVIDAGLGIVPLHREIPQMFERDPLLIITHTHLDHVGGAHEFKDIAVHDEEAHILITPGPVSLDTHTLYGILGIDVPPNEEPSMLRRVPNPGYDPTQYGLVPATPTRRLKDGDEITTLGTPMEVLATPGHSPGSICLYDHQRRWLFTGDTIYQGQLLDTIHGADQADYRRTMNLLSRLEVSAVFPGHGPGLGPGSLKTIADNYLSRS